MRNIRKDYKETMGFLRRLFSVKIYTDGYCKNNGTPHAKGAFGIYFPNHEHMNISKTYPLTIPPTSKRCELLAVQYSLVLHWIYFRNEECIIHTDSDYTIKSLTSYCDVWAKNDDWKKTNGEDVKNQDLLKPMHVLFSKNGNVKLHHVKSHPGFLDKHSLNHNIAHAFARKGLGYNS
jgi:ribonuclease HI